MKWILVWNPTAPKGNYYLLIIALIAIVFIVFGLKRIIRGSRKEKSLKRYVCSECGHEFEAEEPPMTIPAGGKWCPICQGIAEESDSQ